MDKVASKSRKHKQSGKVKSAAPKELQKTSGKAKSAAPKELQKTSGREKSAAPKVLQKTSGKAKSAASKVLQKTSGKAESAAGKAESAAGKAESAAGKAESAPEGDSDIYKTMLNVEHHSIKAPIRENERHAEIKILCEESLEIPMEIPLIIANKKFHREITHEACKVIATACTYNLCCFVRPASRFIKLSHQTKLKGEDFKRIITMCGYDHYMKKQNISGIM